MRVELGEYLTALRSSRDDLPKLLAVVLEAAVQARRATGSVRDIDAFARYGGEEFVLILPETSLEGGLAVAEKLRLATHRTPFCGKGPEGGVRLTVSIGVACFPEHATQPEELLRAADEALYEAKLQGRDRWSPPAAPAAADRAARAGHGTRGQGRVRSSVANSEFGGIATVEPS